MLIDLHAHTWPRSHDSVLNPDDLIVRAKAAGLDAICFTEHDTVWDHRSIEELCAKHNFLVRSAAELLEAVPLAFTLAESGRPGPVAIDVPKDVQNERITIDEAALPAPGGRKPLQPCADEAIVALAHLLFEAKRPVLYFGGGVMAADAAALACELARRLSAPARNTPSDPAARRRSGRSRSS